MTERVQLNLERMIPELEEYKNRGVFSTVECQKIIHTRKKHEFRLQRFDKKLLDILRYIESETLLETIRDKRIKKKNLNISYYDKKITEKIIKLYKEALFRFTDKKIIVKFTEYAIKKEMHADLKDVYASYCLKNTGDAELWIYCAVKLYEIDDVDSSRAMFFKGIRLNPEYHKLRVEFFRMEVLHILRVMETNIKFGIEEEQSDEILSIAYNIYLDTVEICKENKMIEEMKQIAKKVEELYKKIQNTGN
ncbi:U3 small nucleolar RNA-associated protein 6 (UTP6) [Vairimorpha necatrix]|uniref:U3 small nucleolar RNA-associated protein 6 (UTP6) n=1 Tax=Vairimorpha necatrix TaxID=6039 RepID=A0AAX4JB15_9MICR